MKKLLFLLAVLAVPGAAQETGGFVWRLQPEAGSKWAVRSFMHMKLTELIPIPKEAQIKAKLPAQMKVDLDIVEKLTANWDVVSKDKDGNLTVNVAYRTLSLNSKAAMDGKPAPAAMQNLMNAQLAGLSDSLGKVTLTMKVSPQSKVLSVQGTEHLTEAILKGVKNDNPALTAMMKPFLEKMYSKENFQSLISSAGEIPSSPIDVGRGFSYAQEMPKTMPLPLAIYGTHILTKRENGLAVFADSATFETTDSPFPMPQQLAMSMKVALTGELKGTTAVAEDSGLPRDIDLTMRMQGKLTASAKDLPEPMIISLWMNMTNHTVFEPRS